MLLAMQTWSAANEYITEIYSINFYMIVHDGDFM